MIFRCTHLAKTKQLLSRPSLAHTTIFFSLVVGRTDPLQRSYLLQCRILTLVYMFQQNERVRSLNPREILEEDPALLRNCFGSMPSVLKWAAILGMPLFPAS